jgi:erythromycin esterase-like protein
MIGDASHGTSEFYSARAKITQYLVEHHGFNIVAVEADWPDAECIDRYVRWRAGPKASIASEKAGGDGEREKAFKRFPTWMWRNQETLGFVEWLRAHNAGLTKERRTGFYGLDLYSMGVSMNAVIQYLDHVDPSMAEMARKRYAGLQPWVEEPQDYGLATLVGVLESYEADVLQMLRDLLSKRLEYAARHENGDEFHSAEQNARLVAGGNAQSIQHLVKIPKLILGV